MATQSTPTYNIDMRAQIVANVLIMCPDYRTADVLTSFTGTHWRAILMWVKDGHRFHSPTKECATPEAAMRELLEDTSKHVYLELKYNEVID